MVTTFLVDAGFGMDAAMVLVSRWKGPPMESHGRWMEPKPKPHRASDAISA